MRGSPPPSLAHLPHRIREYARTLPDRWRTFRDGFRQSNLLSWRGPLVRWATIILLVAAVLYGGRTFIRSITIPGSGTFGDTATRRATLYVACTSPNCRAAYTAHPPMDFKDWPLACEKCGQPTVYRATPCPKCHQWFATLPNSPADCPSCAAAKAAAKAAQPPPRPTKTADDAEDPW